jgi:glycolate oxidase
MLDESSNMTHGLNQDLEQLSKRLGADAVVLDEDRMAGYRWDRAHDPDAGTPMAVVRVSSTDDVSHVVQLAAQYGIPIVIRGAGTGLSGGSTAIDGCIVISTERMRSIHIDPVTRTAVVEPGALNAEVKRAAAEHGLWYPPDPSSFEICSIGGNIATNAGGLCCVKYGVTSDYVLGMTVVLADGTAVELGGPRLKDVAGYSLTKLFVGSEGTLGVVTRIVLRLVPKQRAPHTLVAVFPTLEGATDSVLAITGQLRPAMLEFMDQTSINAVEDVTKMGLDRSAAAMLVMQSDEPAEAAAAEILTMTRVCEFSSATEVFATNDIEEGEAFVAARRMAIPAVERKGPLLLEDVGVPVPELGNLVRGIANISSSREVTIAVIAHAGDGNTHPLIVCDPSDPDQTARAHRAYGEIMELAMGLGGTITGEHGVGRLKKTWLPDYLGPEALLLNRRIKDALDPQGLFGAGVMFE